MLVCDTEVDFIRKTYDFLIVEDSEFMNKMLYSELSEYKRYKLDQAYSFEETAKKLQKKSYDFILLDLNLPDAFGEDLLDAVKQLSDAKIIVFTAEIDSQVRESLFKKGILDYILKENDLKHAVKSIEHTVEGIEKNKNTTVLVIDDSMFMCKQMQSILGIRNYTTKIALSATDGMEILRSENLNLVILDMELPDKHGLDVLKEIKNLEESCHIPVIILSGSNDPDIIRKCLKLGASDFVKKPFNIEEFVLKADLSVENNRKYIEVLCKQKMVQEYKEAVDEANIVTKTDLKGIITFANDKFCEISGYSREELIGKSHSVVRHPDMPKELFEDLWKTIKSQKTWQGEIKNLCKDGSSYYVMSTIKPIVDYTGKTIEYIGIRTDITELEAYREILEENLTVSNNNLHYLTQYEDAMNDYVSVIKTDLTNKIEFVNDNFCKLSKYTKEELLGQDAALLRSKKHQNVLSSTELKREIQKKKRVDFLFENQDKEGKNYYVDTKIYPIYNLQKEIEAFFYVMHDVTELISLHKELESTQKEIIYKMGEIGESRSEETGNHVKRVAEYSRLLALLAGLGRKNAELLFTASPMHDIGKVAIADDILKKPGPLSDAEFEIMKKHTEIGYNILKNSKRPILKAAAIVAYRHHEKWDGTGYPNALKGEQIHIFGRITAVADVFDALGSDRVYKKAWEMDRIIDFFQEQSGKHFDPNLVAIFLKNFEKFLKIRDMFRD